MRIYRALLRICRALLRICRALLRICKDPLRIYRAVLVGRRLLMEEENYVRGVLLTVLIDLSGTLQRVTVCSVLHRVLQGVVMCCSARCSFDSFD